jgi:hypothetical protein
MSSASKYEATPSYATFEAMIRSQRWATYTAAASLISVPLWLVAAWKCRQCATPVWVLLTAVGLVGMPGIAYRQRTVITEIQRLRQADGDFVAPLLFYELHQALASLPEEETDLTFFELSATSLSSWLTKELSASEGCICVGGNKVTLRSLKMGRCQSEAIADFLVAATERNITVDVRDLTADLRTLIAIQYVQAIFEKEGGEALNNTAFTSQLETLLPETELRPPDRDFRLFLRDVPLLQVSGYVAAAGLYLQKEDGNYRVLVHMTGQTWKFINNFVRVVGRYVPVHLVVEEQVEDTISGRKEAFLNQLEASQEVTLHSASTCRRLGVRPALETGEQIKTDFYRGV